MLGRGGPAAGVVHGHKILDFPSTREYAPQKTGAVSAVSAQARGPRIRALLPRDDGLIQERRGQSDYNHH